MTTGQQTLWSNHVVSHCGLLSGCRRNNIRVRIVEYIISIGFFNFELQTDTYTHVFTTPNRICRIPIITKLVQCCGISTRPWSLLMYPATNTSWVSGNNQFSPVYRSSKNLPEEYLSSKIVRAQTALAGNP